MNLRQTIIASVAVVGSVLAAPCAFADGHDHDHGGHAQGWNRGEGHGDRASGHNDGAGWRGNAGNGRGSSGASFSVNGGSRGNVSVSAGWRGGETRDRDYRGNNLIYVRGGERGGYRDGYRGRGRGGYVRPRFGPAYRFEWNSWRGGHWYHSWHNGAYAWWWVIGDDWFDYAAPVYPYPYPVYYYDDPVYDEAPPPYNYDQGPPPESGPPQSAPQQSWYYCESPKGYYPYVSSCPGGWRAVPATPPGNIRGQ